MNLAKTLIRLIDLTSLQDSDDEASIRKLCEQARNPVQHVAAVCIKPEFITLARQELAGTSIRIATVANFPFGDQPSLDEIEQSIQLGADEIDVVFPKSGPEWLKEVKTLCQGRAVLKVILETGELPDQDTVRERAVAAVEAGADFLKTSTGKTPHGASLEAARTLLEVIAETPDRQVGLKVSGGIREPEQAAQYYQLACDLMGSEWVSPATFRIGASALLNQLMHPHLRV